MDDEEHKRRHRDLHQRLDELVADFITHTGKRPSKSTVLELIEWSARQVHKLADVDPPPPKRGEDERNENLPDNEK